MFVIVTRGDLREEIDMADEAFALSPISARAALPGEEDYAAISEAFMETSRGRWFLAEYAKRNRNADTRMAMDDDVGVLVHAATIEAHMALDFHRQWRIKAAGDGVLTHRVADDPLSVLCVLREFLASPVAARHYFFLQVDLPNAWPTHV